MVYCCRMFGRYCPSQPPGGGVVLLGIFSGGVLPVSPKPDLFKPDLQNPGLWAEIMSSLLKLECKKFLQMHLEFAYFYSVLLTDLGLKR